jgi:hypothetical protein
VRVVGRRRRKLKVSRYCWEVGRLWRRGWRILLGLRRIVVWVGRIVLWMRWLRRSCSWVWGLLARLAEQEQRESLIESRQSRHRLLLPAGMLL